MILRGEAIVERPAAGRLRAAIRVKSSALVNEALLGSAELAAVGLIALALLAGTLVTLSPGHFRPVSTPWIAIPVSAGTLAALVLSFSTSFPLRTLLPRNLRRLLGIAALVTLPILAFIGAKQAVTSLNVVSGAAPYNNDGAAMDLYAAREVLHGHNPYIKTNIVYALAQINAPGTVTTPLMDGQFRGVQAYPSPDAIERVFLNDLQLQPRQIPPEFESKYNYPAGSFLFILPFVWAGMRDMRFLYVLAVLAMGAYLWRRSSRALRPLVPLIVLANVPLVLMTAGGQPDPLYGLFLMLGFAEWPGEWISPGAMGLAVSIKQIAWFFVPFYLLLIVRERGWREALRRVGIMLPIFALINAPFILQGPAAYLSSISAPMSDPMFPMGVGIIALFVGNLLPMLPKIAFTAAELGAWSLSLVGAAAFRRIAPAALLVLGALPLFFAWRSLTSYFYLVPLLALAVTFAEHERQVRQRRLT